MAEKKHSRLSTEWTEVEPTIFEKKQISGNDLHKWSSRRGELINSALKRATEVSGLNDKRSRK